MAEPVRTERVKTAAKMVRQHANVTPKQAAACLRVDVTEVMVELGVWTQKGELA